MNSGVGRLVIGLNVPTRNVHKSSRLQRMGRSWATSQTRRCRTFHPALFWGMLRPLSLFAILALVLTREPLHAQRPTHPAGTILRTLRLTGQAYGVAIDQAERVYVSKVDAGE